MKYIRGGRYLPPFRHEGFTGSPFRNEDGSLTAAQKRGWKVSSDAKVGCIECHPGDPKNPRALFSDAQTHDVGTC